MFVFGTWSRGGSSLCGEDCIPGVGKLTETGTTFFPVEKKTQMDVVWFGAQSTTGSYFCKGIGLPRHRGLS